MTAAFQAGQRAKAIEVAEKAGDPHSHYWGITSRNAEMIVDALIGAGLLVAVVEPPTPPKPALPTRPGIYRDSSGDAWCLESDGRWWFGSSVNRSDDPGVVQNAPFTALGSLKDHAEVVANWFDSRLPDGTGNGRAYNSYTVAKIIRAEFGEASE